MSKNEPLVYIIILNWNGVADTLECLNSLKSIQYLNHKIIVIDNGSKDNESEFIKRKFPEIEVIRNKENKGFAEGNNIGIKEALKKGAEYILLLNNDTIVSPNFLTILINFAQKEKKIGIVGPKILYYNSDRIWFNGGKIWWWLGFNKHLEKLKRNKNSKIRQPKEVDFITGCALLIKRKVIEKIGLLDSIYFNSFEDVDLCARAKKLGYKCVVVPEAVIWHKVSSAWGVKGHDKITSFQAYYYSRNALIFAKKNLLGIKKFFYLLSQYTIRLGFNLVLCKDNRARLNYLKGLFSCEKEKKDEK